MASETCARCGTKNDDGAKFCEACGASMAPQIHCPNCNTMNPLGRAFCTRCGGSLEHAGWGDAPPEPGAVIDGQWERSGDELIRRVDPEDARRFLGSRTVRVPAGTVGVVLADGVVERVLPPGERTSLSLFQRVASFFLGRERTAFYLVDQRPFPVPFVVRTRPSATGEVVKTQVMVTFLLPKGDRDALSQFIANVVRARTSVSTGELYNLLRPEVARIAQEVLERQAAAGDISYPDAEAEIRRQLADAIGSRYGLYVDATLAPLTTVASVNLQLGTGPAPRTRACVKCRAEIPASMRFCDACGEKQPTVPSTTGNVDSTSALFTSDGQQVELDLVVRVSGQHDDFTPAKIAPALAQAAGAYLRTAAFTSLVGAGGFAALEQAMRAPAEQALAALGMQLQSLAVVDARSKTGQWVLSARADLERAAEDVRLGLSWLEQRDNELDLEQLTITRVLRQAQQRRDQAFANDASAVADKERREDLANRGTNMAIAAEQRAAAVDAAQRARRTAQVEGELSEADKRKRHELELRRAEDEAQLAKLRGMAALEREGRTLEHEQEMAKRAGLKGLTPDEMIAMQAGELAKGQGGGAAWAAVLANRGDVERRHAEEVKGVYEKAMESMAQVATSRAQAPLVQTNVTPRTCPACNAAMRPDAKFCPACGAG